MLNFKGFKLQFLLYIIISLIIHFSFISLLSGFQNPFHFMNIDRVLFVDISSNVISTNKILKSDIKKIESNFEDSNNFKRQDIKNTENKDFYNSTMNNTDASNKAISDYYTEKTPENNLQIDNTKEYYKQNHLMKYQTESYSYDIYWLGIYAGNATLEAYNVNGMIRIITHVQSAPLISAFYKVEDFAESKVVDGLPYNFRVKQKEGRYTSDKETIFDIPNNKIIFYNYKKGNKTEHNITNADLWDVLSGFFYLRTKQIIIGTPIYINIFDSNKFYKTAVHVIRKENINVLPLGDVQTVLIKPELQTEGIFKKTGDIYIWLTDDDEKIPVKIETKVPVGNVVAELKKLEIR